MSDIIIMIHGMWTGSWTWDNYKTFFEKKDYLCVTPTLRYHDTDRYSKPEPELGTVSLLDYVDDLEKLIEKFDTPPILIGHSMGGLVAQILAARGLAKAVVLLAPASPRGIMALKPSVIKSFRSTLTTRAFWKKPIHQTFDEAVYACLGALPAAEQQRIYSRMGYESGRVGFEIGFWYFDLKKATRVDESKITCPMLIMAGAMDRITPVSVIRKIADKYKAVAAYKEYEHHANWIISEPGWENTAEDIFSWLSDFALPASPGERPHIEQRQHKRISYHTPVIYSEKQSPIHHQSETDNYSLNGAKLFSAVPLSTGSDIDLKLLDTAPGFDGLKANHDYSAEVVWCRQNSDALNYDIGVRIG